MLQKINWEKKWSSTFSYHKYSNEDEKKPSSIKLANFFPLKWGYRNPVWNSDNSQHFFSSVKAITITIHTHTRVTHTRVTHKGHTQIDFSELFYSMKKLGTFLIDSQLFFFLIPIFMASCVANSIHFARCKMS